MNGAPAAARTVRATCPVCDATDSKLLGTRARFRVRLCRRCAHTFVAEIPTQEVLAKLYETYGYDVANLDSVPQCIFDILGDVVATFEPHRTGAGRLLDVGFGPCALLRAARSRGWQTYGIEASRAAVEQGRRRSLGELVEGDFLDAPWPGEFFDVIVMTELIEHLVEPQPFLRHAWHLLRPGGLLYLTTPHGRGISGRALGASWSVVHPPEHLHLCSLKSMRLLLRNAGYSRVHVVSRGLHPHELVAQVRRYFGKRASAIGSERSTRVEDSAKLNELVMRSRLGRATKAVANGVFALTRLGDGLSARAMR